MTGSGEGLTAFDLKAPSVMHVHESVLRKVLGDDVDIENGYNPELVRPLGDGWYEIRREPRGE